MRDELAAIAKELEVLYNRAVKHKKTNPSNISVGMVQILSRVYDDIVELYIANKTQPPI